MGFTDVLAGGDGIDTTRAEYLTNQTKWMNDLLQQQMMELNAPYMQYGGASFEKLAGLLGVDAPSQMHYGSVDELVNAIMPVWNSSNPSARTGKPLYYDPITGAVTGIPGGIPLGITTKTGTEADVRAAAESLYTDLTKPVEHGEDFGSLLEPFTMEDYQESPNYQFNLDQGQQAIDRAAAARGDYLSPEAVKELTEYSQNLASNEYLNSYNMFNQNNANVYDMLMGATNVGQQGVAQQGAQNQAYMGNLTDLNGQLAQLNLASQADKQNQRASAFNNLASIAKMAVPMMGGFGGGSMLPAGFNNAMGAGWSGNTFMGY